MSKEKLIWFHDLPLDEAIDHQARQIMIGVKLDIDKALYEVCGAYYWPDIFQEERYLIVPDDPKFRLRSSSNS